MKFFITHGEITALSKGQLEFASPGNYTLHLYTENTFVHKLAVRSLIHVQCVFSRNRFSALSLRYVGFYFHV